MDTNMHTTSGNNSERNHPDTIKTLTHLDRILLHLSRPAVDRQEYETAEQRLGVIIGNIKRILNGNPGYTDERIVRIFQEVIFGGIRLQPTRNTGHGESFLGSTLARRIGNCTGLTSIYLAAARPLGVPMFASFGDTHVRVILRGSSRDTIIEPMNKGMVEAAKKNMTGTWRTLTDREFVAVILNNRAAFLYAKKQEWRACARDLRAALHLFPEHPDIPHNLQEIQQFLSEQVRRGEAREDDPLQHS
ncbi:MAG: hypothetical protein JSV33_13900 [bacterium]|nr:MAG: hypothetical protein JSV33_13900 [bacterium]